MFLLFHRLPDSGTWRSKYWQLFSVLASTATFYTAPFPWSEGLGLFVGGRRQSGMPGGA